MSLLQIPSLPLRVGDDSRSDKAEPNLEGLEICHIFLRETGFVSVCIEIIVALDVLVSQRPPKSNVLRDEDVALRQLMLHYPIKPGGSNWCRITETEWVGRWDNVSHGGPSRQIGRGIDLVVETGGGIDIELEIAARVHGRVAQNNRWRGWREGNLPDALITTVFNHVNPVSEDLSVNRRSKPADNSCCSGLIIGVPQFRQIQIEDVLARIVERSSDRVSRRIARGEAQDESVILEGNSHSADGIEHQAQRRTVRRECTQRLTQTAGILN